MHRRQGRRDSNPQFDRFWAAYPRRVARVEAVKAWNQINPAPETVDAMIQALEWQQHQPTWRKDDGQFIPYPASWLRAERWTDEPPAALQRRVKVHWSEECAEMHGGTCDKQWTHEMKKRDMAV